ncbi:cupin domain-containing protein [Gleimia sp. 6138-11-ORH1]|uniref:cupin domain-containing protein n=1 Tax=Gleimia sp. 6138-11-ORH1 TaxID=2973937 RepID=UPI00216A4C40|nr:cupin domain-containing protein [Gleimia sp. 6138-11-ORH1]MCS4484679.1 cupin domain-containing protein [Gleimia sp. 6138-11-ORH1]
MTDHGPNPYVMNIEKATLANKNYRTTLWTGQEMQLTVMSIKPGHDIGLEKHDDHDQFIRIEEGKARVQMGPAEDDLSFDVEANDDDAIFIPAGQFHNVTNIGDEDLKLYSIYAPAEHEHGTVHVTYEEAMEAEAHHHHH